MVDGHARDADADAPMAGVGYLWVPHLPLSLALRRADATDGPAIVGGSPTDDGLVVDASDECLAAGVRLGQPLREAWECCPQAIFLPADAEADRRAHVGVLDLVETVATAVEDEGPGRAAFALDRPVGREEGGRILARLRTLVRARLGFRARLALAPGRFAGRIAAERDPGARAGTPLVLVGDVAAYLAPLPLEVLPLPPRVCDRLRLLGITTVGRLAGLPREGLGRRFGPEAVAAHRLAAGEDERPIVPRRRPDVRAARHAFDPPVATRAPLLAVAERLLDSLCEGLAAEGRAFRSLGVAVEGEAGALVERTASLRAATASPAECRTTLGALVDALASTGPVAAVAVTAGALGPAGGEQLSLVAGATSEARRRQRLEAAAREVERRYPARLRRVSARELPTLLDEYQFVVLPYEPTDGHPAPTAGPSNARAVRFARRNGRSYLVEGGRWDELVALHGCWRAEEWWPTEVTRVYWRVRTRAGRVVTLSRDGDGWRLVEVLD